MSQSTFPGSGQYAGHCVGVVNSYSDLKYAISGNVGDVKGGF